MPPALTLVEGSEPLTLLPLTRDLAALDAALAGGGAVVAYKGGRLVGAATRADRRGGCAGPRLVRRAHVGSLTSGSPDLADTDSAAYLSTVVVLPPRNGRGAQL